MFDHVAIRVASRAEAAEFYAAVLPALGIELTYADAEFVAWGPFFLAGASGTKPATQGLHIGFAAPSRAHVDEFWRRGLASGFRDAGAPGERPEYKPDYYGAFLQDPDGNSVEAVHHGSPGPGGAIDHVWLRTGDVEAARRFYETVVASAGLRLRNLAPDHIQVVGPGGSLSVVAGPPTRNFHLAFPAATDAAVDEFHRALTAAGYRDDGPPGARPQYHPGYYGAFVLDPDGNSVELVHHTQQPDG